MYHSGIPKENYEFEPSGRENAGTLESDVLTTVKPWQTRRLNPWLTMKMMMMMMMMMMDA
jgi:hypothetical protein